MILEITKENIHILKNSFISEEFVEKELENNPFAKFIILRNNDEIIGYLYYSDIYERAEINQFEIEKNHRNCGKGQILLDYLTKIVEKNITLEVKEDNLAAIHLYEKNGFEKKALRKGYYNGIDGILMERKEDSTK